MVLYDVLVLPKNYGRWRMGYAHQLIETSNDRIANQSKGPSFLLSEVKITLKLQENHIQTEFAVCLSFCCFIRLAKGEGTRHYLQSNFLKDVS